MEIDIIAAKKEWPIAIGMRIELSGWHTRQYLKRLKLNNFDVIFSYSKHGIKVSFCQEKSQYNCFYVNMCTEALFKIQTTQTLKYLVNCNICSPYLVSLCCKLSFLIEIYNF